MPCVQIKTNVKTSKEVAAIIKTDLGKAISYLPNKSEEWMLVSIDDNCTMFFGGNGEKNIAMVEVDILGDNIDKDGANKMTELISESLKKNLNIDPKDMYIKYKAGLDWGWNSKNF